MTEWSGRSVRIVERFSNLGRVIDVRNPSNAFAVLASAALAAAALVAGGWSGEPQLGGPISVGLAAFLSWVLAREIDPDREEAAAAAAMLGGALALALPDAAPAAVYLLAVGARIAVRTTGLPPRSGDLAVHVPIAAWFAQDAVGWVAAAGLAGAVALDALTTPGRRQPQLWWAAGILGAATTVAVASGAFGGWESPESPAMALAAAGLLGGLVALAPETPRSVADRTGVLLDPRRVRLGRLVVVISLAITVVAAGAAGVLGAAGAFGAAAVAGATRLGARDR
jgi:hypothetical protein